MSQDLQGFTFFVKTFGCQMNENDSEQIAGILTAAGSSQADGHESADIVIVNTCAVRQKSEEKLFSYLGRLSSLKKKKTVLIGVAGCMAQVYNEKLFAKRPFVDFVIGPDCYAALPSFLKNVAGSKRLMTTQDKEWKRPEGVRPLRGGKTSAYVTIMEGCDNFCAYCIVPFSRGREKFRPLTGIFGEIRDLAAAGYKEIQLLGQNVNSYRDPESGRDFASLLDEIGASSGIPWIRFLTSHPRNFNPETIRAMSRHPRICRQLHLPLQSGSTAVLKNMNRGYSWEEYLELVGRLRTALPEILLSTDIIVGYPGETESDFEATCRSLQEIRFANIFSFRYSPRPLTASSRLIDDVPLADKKRRLIHLQELQKSIQLEINRSFIGREIQVLCLGTSVKGNGLYAGRTEGYQVVNFSSSRDVIGRFVTVTINDAGPYSLRGEAVRALET